MSTLRVTNIEAKGDPSSPSVDEKLKLTNSTGDIVLEVDGKNVGAGQTVFVGSGIVTATQVNVGTAVTISAGIITATSFSGNVVGNVTGNLTGNADSATTATTATNALGITTTQITVGNSFLKSEAVGLGTTSTAGRDAGISTAPGTIIYNETTGIVQVYKRNKGWRTIDDTGDTFITIQYLVVAGGGAGAGQLSGGGGAGGLLEDSSFQAEPGTYTITVGAGGAAATSGSGLSATGDNGANSVFGSFTALGGGRGGAYSGVPGTGNTGFGALGGSGGGGGDDDGSPPNNFGLGTPGQGNPGGNQLTSGNGGGGGGAGAAGQDGGYPPTGVFGDGGVGSITTIVPAPIATSRSVGEVSGSDVYFAGGGGGGGGSSGGSRGTGGVGGLGGGGNGGGPTGGSGANGSAGTANTGGGGGASDWNSGGSGNAGGSGVVILRGPNAATFTFSAGVTVTNDPVGSDTVYIITATSSTSETVTITE